MVSGFCVKDSSDFSSFQLDRLMKQSQLSQRLENVRQEMSYSAGGVDDLVENAEDATVESNRLASDELTQYVLIKGSLNNEETGNNDAATDDTKAAEEECDAEDDEWKPGRKPSQSQSRMGNEFVLRKIERDRNAGRKFAPVCEVKLSSSDSSSDADDVIGRRRTVKSSDVKFISSDDEDDFISTASVTAPQSHPDVCTSATTTVPKPMEEKRKLPPPEDVIRSKRWKSDESSGDSMVEDEPNQLVESPLVPKGDVEVEQKSPAEPVAAEISLPDMQPNTAEDGSTNIQSHEPSTDKQDELDSEAESRNEETGEVSYKKPANGKCFISSWTLLTLILKYLQLFIFTLWLML